MFQASYGLDFPVIPSKQLLQAQSKVAHKLQPGLL
jgi:hypothetical protein